MGHSLNKNFFNYIIFLIMEKINYDHSYIILPLGQYIKLINLRLNLEEKDLHLKNQKLALKIF